MRPLTAATSAICGHPPIRRVHCRTAAESPPRIVVVVGALHANRSSRPSRQAPLLAMASGVAVSAGPLAWTRAAGCCQVPQKISTRSREPDGNWLQFSPLELAPRLIPLLASVGDAVPPT